MKSGPLIFPLTLFLCSIIIAQVNTELMRKENPDKRFSNVLSLDLGYQTSQDKYFDVVFNGSSNYFLEDNFHSFLIIDYQSGYLSNNDENEIIINSGFGHLRFTKRILKKTEFELFFQAGFNNFILIRDRKLFGSGLRRNIIKKDKIKSIFGFGFMQEREIYDLMESPKKSLLRCTSYSTFSAHISDNIVMNNILYFQPAVKKINDFRLLIDNEIQFKINEIFSTKLEINFRFDNEPHVNSKKIYLQIYNGFEFNF